jgi:predicted DNA binding CopG/RHH family protein
MRKTERIYIRFDRYLKEDITQKAATKGRTISQYIRDLINADLQK